MKIIFTQHAELKFDDLKKQGFRLTKEQVEDALNMPQDVTEGEKGRFVVQRAIDATHMIRVIYEKEKDVIRVITFYPARRRRYGSQV